MVRAVYAIVLTEAVREHLKHIAPKWHRDVQVAITERLTREPLAENRNRKPLRNPNLMGEHVWEIRFGPNNRFRVFYDVHEAERTVVVVAIGEKLKNKLFIAGEEIEL
jgi:mRNA-degrading endonuclease RelE of RelBE toxin-antitoxin system